MEIVSGLFLSKRVQYRNGKSAHLTDLGKGFEWLFNIKLGDYHQKHEDVIKRKTTKLTEFLNELANLIRKEHEKKGIDNQVFSINLYGSTYGTPVICLLPFAELCFINRLVIIYV